MREDDFLKGTLVGALIGAGLALLFAPKSGRETREYLAQTAKKIKEGAEETYDTLVDRVVEEYRAIKEMTDQEADELIDRLKQGLKEAQEKTSREIDQQKW